MGPQGSSEWIHDIHTGHPQEFGKVTGVQLNECQRQAQVYHVTLGQHKLAGFSLSNTMGKAYSWGCDHRGSSAAF